MYLGSKPVLKVKHEAPAGESRKDLIVRTGREIAWNSLYWFPEVGPIYLDETMVPKHLLDEVIETRSEERLDDDRTQVTYRLYVRANDKPLHVLYGPSDFTQEEIDRKNVLADYVINGGLGVCKQCGAAEAELDEFVSCADYDKHKRKERERHDRHKG